MATLVIFKGNEQETTDILAAFSRNCTCEYVEPEHRRSVQCAGHVMLATDQQGIDDLLFARWRAVEMTVEEFSEDRKDVPHAA